LYKSFRFLAAASLLLSFLSLEAIEPAPLQNYCPVVLVNNSTLPSSSVYFIAHGTDKNGVPCFLVPNTSTGVCSYVYPTPSGSPSSAGSSVTLDQLPAATNLNPSITNSAYLIYLPISSVASRAYLSINSPMYLQTSVSAAGVPNINDVNGTIVNDPNYYTLYQDFEFVLTDSNANSGTQINLNLSWVDYFCLPMQLTTYSYPSNTEVMLSPPTNPQALPAGTSGTREAIITSVMASLTAQSSSPYPLWDALGVGYFNNPYTDPAPPSNYLRILAMKNSISLGSNSGGNIPFSGGSGYIPRPCFPSDYFSNSTYGAEDTGGNAASYMQAIYSYYQSNPPLYVKIYPSGQSPATYEITADATPLTLDFNAQNPANPSYKLSLSSLTAEQLLAGANFPFTYNGGGPDSAAYTNALATPVSALFTVGQFPLTQETTSSGTPFDNSNAGFSNLEYFSNPIVSPAPFPWSGIWYNLYSSLLHNLMIGKTLNTYLNIKNSLLGLGYAYDFDDVLNMSGIIAGINVQDSLGHPSQTPVVEPYVVVKLESLSGTNIPPISQDSYNYPVTVGPAANGVTVTFNYYDGSSSQSATALTSATLPLGNVQVDSSHPFQITFSFNAAPDYPAPTSYTYDLNLLRQIATPLTPTSTFSSIDRYFQASIVFDNTAGSASSPNLTIYYTSTPPGWPG